jgi:DNA-binding transcriptional LysR family regulator
MELSQIRTFLAVARTGSFSHAAGELFRTQPSVSLKIQNLEAELGHQLLERRPQGVSLTPAGEILRRRGNSILREITALTAELADLESFKTGRVSIAASDTVCLYLLPQVIKQFVQNYPGIELRLFTQITRNVLDLVISDQVDIGIVTLPVAPESFETQKLYQDNFLVVYPPGHPLELKRTLSPADLREYPIIHLKPDTVTRHWIDQHLEPFGLTGQVRMEVSTIEVIKRMVEAGLGISILPEMAIDEELHSKRLIAKPLKGVDLKRTVGIAYRKGKYFSRALSVFVADLTMYARQLKWPA